MENLLEIARLEEQIGRSLQQDQLNAAIIAAQEHMRVEEDAKGNRNSYVSIEEICDKTQPYLRANGLTMRQGYNIVGEWPVLDSTLMHNSGQWTRSRSLIPKTFLKEITQSEANMVSQSLGTITTYLKRYAYGSMLGLRIGEPDIDSLAEVKPVAKRITDEQYKSLLRGISGRIELQERLQQRFGIKDLKWLYANLFEEAVDIIKNY